MIRFIVADDHPMVRRGLVSVLEGENDLRCIAEASNANEAMQAIRADDADLVILDISMPGKNGLDALKQIKKEKPRLPVLIMSSHPQDQYALRSIRAGAAGYLTKDASPLELVAAVRQVASGRRYITAELAEELASHVVNPGEHEPHEDLSDREYQTLKMIGAGRTVTEIANTLFLSAKTVSVYRARLLQKMSLKNNAELARYAIEHGLVD